MNDISIGIILLIVVGILSLLYSWITGSDKEKATKDFFLSLGLVALTLIILGTIGWIVFAGWRD